MPQLLLQITQADGKVVQRPLKKGEVVTASPGVQYELLDAQTHKPIKAKVMRDDQHHLLVRDENAPDVAPDDPKHGHDDGLLLEITDFDLFSESLVLEDVTVYGSETDPLAAAADAAAVGLAAAGLGGLGTAAAVLGGLAVVGGVAAAAGGGGGGGGNNNGGNGGNGGGNNGGNNGGNGNNGGATLAAAVLTQVDGSAAKVGGSIGQEPVTTLHYDLTNTHAVVGDVIQVYDNGVAIGTPYTLTAQDIANGYVDMKEANLAVGQHSLTAVITDATGTQAISAPAPLTITQAPDAMVLTQIDGSASKLGASIGQEANTTLHYDLSNSHAVAGDVVQLYDNGVAVGGPYTLTANDIANGFVNFTEANLAVGTHAFVTTITDNSGNHATSVVGNLTITQAPSAPVLTQIDGSPANVGGSIAQEANTTLHYDLTGTHAVAGDTIQVYDGGKAIGSVYTLTANDIANGYANIGEANLAVGTHSFTATITDNSGNQATSVPSSLTITQLSSLLNAPVLTQIDGKASNVGGHVGQEATTTLHYDLTNTHAVAGDKIQVYDGTTALGSAYTLTGADITNGYVNLSESNLAVGGHSFTATITDLSGNKATSAPATLTITQAPAPLVLTQIDGSPANIGGTIVQEAQTTLHYDLTGTHAVAGDVIQVYDTTSLFGQATLPIGGLYMVTQADVANGFVNISELNLAVGTHSFTATLTDNSGNVSTSVASGLTIIAGSSVLNAPVLTQIDGKASNVGGHVGQEASTQLHYDLTGTHAVAGDTIQVFDGGRSIGAPYTLTAIDIADGFVNLSESNLAIGLHTFTATISDNAGHQVTSQPANLTITQAPAAPVLTQIDGKASNVGGSVGEEPVTTLHYDLTGSHAVAGDTLQLYDNGNPLGTTYLITAADVANGYANINAVDLAVGGHAFVATLTDNSGNQATSVVGTLTVTQAPAAPVLTQIDGSPANIGGTITQEATTTLHYDLTGTHAVAGDTIQVYDGGKAIGSVYTLTSTDIANGYANIGESSLAVGSHSFTATITDNSGNQATSVPSSLNIVAASGTLNAPVLTQIDGKASNVGGHVGQEATTTLHYDLTGTHAVAGDTLQVYDGTSALGSVYTLTATDITNGYVNLPESNLAVGNHSFTATITDLSGNKATSQPATLTITQAPAPLVLTEIDGSPANIGGRIVQEPSTTLHYDLTGSHAVAGDTIQVYDGGTAIGGVYVVTQADVANGFANISELNLAVGTHSFTATITDNSGNAATSVASGLTIVAGSSVLNAPQLTQIDGSAANVGGHVGQEAITQLRYDLGGTHAVAGDVIQVYDGGKAIGSPYTLKAVDIVDGFVILPESNLAIGLHTFTATISDNAGHQATSSPANLTITQAPAAPVLTQIDGSASKIGASIGQEATTTLHYDLTGTHAVAGDTIQLYDNGSAVGGLYVVTAQDIANNSVIFSEPNLAVGGHAFVVTIADNSGNQATSAVGNLTITQAPAAPVLTQIDGSPANIGGTITQEATTTLHYDLTGTHAVAGDTIQVYDGGKAIGTPYTLTNTDIANGYANIGESSLAVGSHSFTATITDNSGNQATSVPSSLNIVAASSTLNAPVLTQIDGKASNVGGHVGQEAVTTLHYDLTGTHAVAGDTIQVYDGTSALGSVYTLTATDITNGYVNLPESNLAVGSHSFTATITDLSGNKATSQPATLTVTMPPSALVLTEIDGSPANIGGTIVQEATTTLHYDLSGSHAVAGDTIQVYDGGKAIGSVYTVTAQDIANGFATISESNLALGSHSFTATITDNSGNNATSVPSGLTITAADSNLNAPHLTLIDGRADNVGGSVGQEAVTTLHYDLTGTHAVAGDVIQIFDAGKGIGVPYTLTAIDIADGFVDVKEYNLAIGLHTFTATITDLTGHQATSAPVNLTVTQPPAAVVLTQIDGSAANVNGSIYGEVTTTLHYDLSNSHAVAGDTIQVYDGGKAIGGVYTVTADDVANGYANIPEFKLALGNHSFMATITDDSGNHVNSTVSTLAVLAPPTPTEALHQDTGISPFDHITSNGQIDVSGLLAADTWQYSVDGGATWINGGSGSATGTIAASTFTSDGPHTVLVHQTDVLGNVSGNASLTFTLDTHTPGAPTLSQVDGTAYTNGETIQPEAATTLTYTLGQYAMAGDTVVVHDAALSGAAADVTYTLTQADVNAGKFSVTETNLSTGTHNFTATVTDVAGNGSVTSVTNALTVASPNVTPGVPTITLQGTQNGVDYTGWYLANPVQVNGEWYYQVYYDGTQYNTNGGYVAPSAGTNALGQHVVTMGMVVAENLFDGSTSPQMNATGDPATVAAGYGTNGTTLHTNLGSNVHVEVPTIQQLDAIRSAFGGGTGQPPAWGSGVWSSTATNPINGVVPAHLAWTGSGDVAYGDTYGVGGGGAPAPLSWVFHVI
jgi:hypothetical protein